MSHYIYICTDCTCNLPNKDLMPAYFFPPPPPTPTPQNAFYKNGTAEQYRTGQAWLLRNTFLKEDSIFGSLSELPLGPYFMCTNSEGADETA